MTAETAARLAHRLIEVHSNSTNFFFELDTAENAFLVAEELRAQGCGVLFDSHDFRLNIFMPAHGEALLPAYARHKRAAQ